MSQRLVRETMLPYGKQWLDDEDIEAVIAVLRSDFITQGPAISRFEHNVAKYVGAKYAVAFSNGTAALHGACAAAEIGLGDEVITTPITFVASSNCALYCGATPVFADIKMDTYNIDPDQVEALIRPQTKAIIPVDFTGQPVEIDRIMGLAELHSLVVIQDAAHSLGASYQGKKIGAWAHMTMFSFHPVKHITTGEGGIIVTDNEEYYHKLLAFRSHGITREPDELIESDGPWYYEMQSLGFNYRMTDMQAALGSSQLSKLDGFVTRRKAIVRQYNKAFSTMKGLVIPMQHASADSSWHLYVLRWEKEKFKINRREIFEQLRELQIGVNVHYIPTYRQPYYKEKGYSTSLYPNAEQYYETCISLPLFPKMTEQDVKDVIAAVSFIYNEQVKN